MLTNALVAVLLPLASAAALGEDAIVAHFPGAYFDSQGAARLERIVMETWPGPSALLARWRQDDLGEEERVRLLLGAAAFHDPDLLVLYREAIRSPSQRLRMAAAYGYRDLLADSLPDVTAGVSEDGARSLEAEMVAVATTLRSRPLVAVWLEALLHARGGGLPGYRGVVLARDPAVAVRAVERLMAPEDLDLLVTSYELATRREDRISLLRLMEGLTLSEFVFRPRGVHAGWSADTVYDEALHRLDDAIPRWRGRPCRIDFEEVIAANLARMGAPGVHPLDADACDVWLRVLEKGRPQWAGLAARRLYACGGPWVDISVLRAASPAAQQERRSLLAFYGGPK